MPDPDPQLAFALDQAEQQRPPAYALIHLPDGWPEAGTIEKLLLVMVRDGVPDRGLIVDALDAHWHQVTGSLGEMRDRLEGCQPKRRKT